MAYSDSSHLSDKISYKILFISSYGLKDINLTRFKHLWKHLNNGSDFILLQYKTDVRFELHIFLWIQDTEHV
jgi:hypothetical protein